MAKVKIDASGCWLFTGAHVPRGYGLIGAGRPKKNAYAHKWMLERKLGRPLTKGMYAMHSCDVTNCVNPDHLSEGTPRENVADMFAKGRGHLGTRSYQAVIDSDKVREMRRLRDDGLGFAELGRRFGLTRGAVWNVVHRVTWKHVE